MIRHQKSSSCQVNLSKNVYNFKLFEAFISYFFFLSQILIFSFNAADVSGSRESLATHDSGENILWFSSYFSSSCI